MELKNVKFKTKSDSQRIILQKKLFNLGYSWCSGHNRLCDDFKYLYINKDKEMTNGEYDSVFEKSNNSEINTEEFLIGNYKYKKPKAKNFRVIQRSCKNFVGDYETYEEASKQVPPTDDYYDIYMKVAEIKTLKKTTIKKVKTKL